MNSTVNHLVDMHDSTKLLFHEHAVITEAIDIALHASSLIDGDARNYETTVRNLIQFFRQYADQYHHHKEEIILFPEMEKKNTLLGDGILREMFDQHTEFRDMIHSIESFLDAGEFKDAQQQLEAYCRALLDHIAIENDEVFQIAETIFDDKEMEQIYFRFVDCDRELGMDSKTALRRKLDELSMRLSHAGNQ